jgi:hypothetical protein
MDASEYIAQYCGKNGWENLYEWFNSTSWENKYHLQDWLIQKGMPKGIAEWLAKDVFVVFTDGWHFFKAIMFVCTEYLVAVLLIPFLPFEIQAWQIAIILFLAGGQLFNIIYYRLKKI